MAARGPSYECRSRTYSNPSLAALSEAEKALLTGLKALGATPADPGKLGVAEPPSQPNKLELRRQRMDERRQTSEAGSG